MATGRVRRRIDYLWNEATPDGVELLSATLSFTFGLLLLYHRHDDIFVPALGYAILCVVASTCKVAGVLLEVGWLRVAGLLLGVIFWSTLAYAHWRVNGSVAWLSYLALTLAQLWAIRQVVRGGLRG